jgi:hypothetical protein
LSPVGAGGNVPGWVEVNEADELLICNPSDHGSDTYYHFDIVAEITNTANSVKESHEKYVTLRVLSCKVDNCDQ